VSEGGFAVAAAAVLGAILGSFLNVCIVRLPVDESIVYPASRCPKCRESIAWYDNVPVLSWLVLRGRCRHCGDGISALYPIVETLVALLWAASVWRFGVTDARTYLIPDEYTLGGLVLGLGLALRGGVDGLLAAAIGAAVGFGVLYAVAWIGELVFKKEAMGGGDIKMMAMVGAFVGWRGVLMTIFGGAALGALVFVPLHFVRPRLVPFGVFLAAAAALVYLWGDLAWAWYMRLAQPPPI
jgi:leader peptidase (prepilin peptidase)/N-methyltransferase